MSLKDRLKKVEQPCKPKLDIQVVDELFEGWDGLSKDEQLKLVKEFLMLHNQDLSKTVFKFCVDKKYLFHIILPPTSLCGVVLRVNKIGSKKLEELVDDKSDLIKILRALESRSNILITGGQGKTTLLDAILTKVSGNIITLENSPQLQIESQKIVKLLKTLDIKEFALSKFNAKTVAIDDCTYSELEYISQFKFNHIVVLQDYSTLKRIEHVSEDYVVINIEDYKISVC